MDSRIRSESLQERKRIFALGLHSILFMELLYHFGMRLYGAAIQLAALFSGRASAWVNGRKNTPIKQRLGGKLAWFHCASLGEFEQGRPVLEGFREQHPDWQILLTFFSPSGFEVRKNYPVADYVCYLPLDTPGRAKRFLDHWKPDFAVFVKYEFWFGYIAEMSSRNIPLVFISSRFRPGQLFFRRYGRWFLQQLKKVRFFYVQDDASETILKKHGVSRVSVSGDTRFDRVFQVAEQQISVPFLKEFASGGKLLIAGSTWPSDMDILLPMILNPHAGMRFLIAPHQVSEKHLVLLEQQLKGRAIRFSRLKEPPDESRVIILDSMGMLSKVYRYGNLAFIGGGFGEGIHNILEAACYGLPVFFGPNYRRFSEAVDLISLGGAFPVSSTADLRKHCGFLISNPLEYELASIRCTDYVASKTGATARILTGLSALTDS